MDGKQRMTFIVMSVVLAALAVTVTASALPSTPLYTYRMEQASHKMHFLPTEMNGFTYTAEKGYTLDNPGVRNNGGGGRLGDSWLPSCPNMTCATCDPVYTCLPTSCQQTCDTCFSTCLGYQTCDTSTCWPFTCYYTFCDTCDAPTCEGSCLQACETLEGPCIP